MSRSQRNLIVDAGQKAVRIDVLDSSFSVKARGYGRVETELPTGFYTIRYSAGDARQDQDITLLPGQEPFIPEPVNLEFSCAAPIEYTSTSSSDHQEHAIRLSATPTLKFGHGAQLFTFVRDLNPGGPQPLTQGLSLHHLDGELVFEFDQVVESSANPDEPRWAGCNIDLDPGIYRLQLVLKNGQEIETTIVACPGWQSQIFLLRQYDSSGAQTEWPQIDLFDATQLMAPSGQGFEPKSRADDLRLSELARLALARGWQGIHTPELKKILQGKWRDPMLGILGTHLLLMRKEPDLNLAEQVVRRLRNEILHGFRHPDVEILALEIARLRGTSIDMPPILTPPLLRRSWRMLMKATAKNPSLVPAGSLTSMIADRFWGSGAWLIWEVPKQAITPTDNDWLSRIASSSRASKGNTSSTRSITRSSLPGAFEAGRETKRSLSLVEFSIEGSDESNDHKEYVELEKIATSLAKTLNTDKQGAANVDYSTIRKALQKLRPFLTELLKTRTPDNIVRKTKLDNVEFSLLAFLASQLSERRQLKSKSNQDLFPLTTLVEQLNLPAERIQSSMTTLLLKLLLERQKKG